MHVHDMGWKPRRITSKYVIQSRVTLETTIVTVTLETILVKALQALINGKKRSGLKAKS
jgi:hypothetical protein